MITALEGGEGSASHPGRSLPPGRPGTHCTGGWVGPRAGLDRCGKSRPPPGFDPRTVQPVAQSLYRLSYLAPTKKRPHKNCGASYTQTTYLETQNTHTHTHIHTPTHTYTHAHTHIHNPHTSTTHKPTHTHTHTHSHTHTHTPRAKNSVHISQDSQFWKRCVNTISVS
jgi:hypothetical protein